MKVKAYAKINLALDVLNKREDGYHDLEMIMAPITLHDLLYINIIDSGIKLASNSKVMPVDEKNIAYKVAKLMIDTYKIEKGVEIFIYKHIPTQAGLGGGSADGAAVIKAFNKLFKLKLTNQQMAQIGQQVGADIPFCIYDKIAFVEGIGEKLQFIDKKMKVKVLLVKPKKGVSTKKAFEQIDLLEVNHSDCRKLKEGIEEDDYQKIIDNLKNSLESPSVKMVPEIQSIKDKMIELGFDGALMSGSGSCVFGLTKDKKTLERGYRFFKEEYYFVRKSGILNQ